MNNKRKNAQAPVYDDSYDNKLKESAERIKNRADFSYNAATDPVYKKYRDDYMAQGRLAMRDASGQAAQLSGGYGSSYAHKVGQQHYDSYLSKLGDVIPELYQLAYSRYDRQGQRLQEEYEAIKDLRDREYEHYTHELDAYNSELETEYKREKDAQEKARWESERAKEEAALKAKYGDFSAYAALYGNETAEAMRRYWISTNPKAAYGMGLISPESYYYMTGEYAPGYEVQSRSSQTYYSNKAPDGRSAQVVQRELRNMGYNIAVDGAWGEKSQAAWDKAYGKKSQVQMFSV